MMGNPAPLKIAGSMRQLPGGATPAVGSPAPPIDPSSTREDVSSPPDDRAALATYGFGARTSAGSDLRARLGQPTPEISSPVSSRPPRRKSLNVLLLAGVLVFGAPAIPFGRGEGVGTSEVAFVASLPQPVGIAGATERDSTGATKAARVPPMAETIGVRENDRRDASPPTVQQAVWDGARKAIDHNNVTRAASTSEPQPPAIGTSGGARFGIGDKVKISFYERIDDAERDKWGRTSPALQGFQQRQEFSGEYAVQDDGKISLPLLGSFSVADLSSGDLRAVLENSFEKLTGRKGFVTILSLERPPVYVLGPVKSPGSYKYVPGMTVLHTVALAGGFDRQNVEPWQRVEAVREIEKRRGAIEGMLKAVARAAVLKSERDGSAAKLPPRLLQLASEAEARKLIADESERRSPIVFARRNRERALSASAQAAKQEVQMLSNRLRPLDDLIKLREERANAMRSLQRGGTISNLVMVQVQSELADAQQRRQDAVNQYAMAQQRAALVEQEQAKFHADTRTEVEAEILAIEQQIAANEREFATSDGILGALRVTSVQYMPSSGMAEYAYEIVRQKGVAGPVALAANGMTTLQPGDLVRVIPDNKRGREDPATQPTHRVPDSSAADAGSDRKPDAIPARERRVR